MDISVTVRHYIINHRDRHNLELEWFREQPSLASAIELAAKATNQQGKRYSHQRRLKKVVLEEAKSQLLASEELIKGCKDFDSLLKLIDELLKHIRGIGELYCYDTALRIGAWLKLSPKKVYLHAGTRTGASLIGIDPNATDVEMCMLPRVFEQLSPEEVEDVLCIYKSYMSNSAQAIHLDEIIDHHC